jgi:3-oxoacyl-[acyl-carrier protein] reductase
MDINLSGKRAIVCGSSQGIGRAAAMELASLGASITLLARNSEALKNVKAELTVRLGQTHSYGAVDFSNSTELKTKIEDFVSENQPVHILVNNTGGPQGGPILDATVDEFTQTFSNHHICNQILTQAVVPGMKSARYGRIINLISTSVKQPIKDLGVSNTIRAAVAHWAKTLAGELGPFGITVNNVLPGATKTTRLAAIIESRAKKSGKGVEEISKDMISEIPAGRFAEPAEIAYTVAFLATPAAAYINGVNLAVDGGRTLCL